MQMTGMISCHGYMLQCGTVRQKVNCVRCMCTKDTFSHPGLT